MPAAGAVGAAGNSQEVCLSVVMAAEWILAKNIDDFPEILDLQKTEVRLPNTSSLHPSTLLTHLPPNLH